MKGYSDNCVNINSIPNASHSKYAISTISREVKKYSIIYASPLWKKDKNIEDIEKKYLSFKALTELNIKNITAEDAVLFLWVNFSLLQKAFVLMESWGFKYKTIGFSWIKLNKKNKQLLSIPGLFTKENCELCLIGIKGKFKPINKNIGSCIISEAEEHSNNKPIIIRENIVKICGDLPRVELFAENKIEGWDIYNYTNEHSIIL